MAAPTILIDRRLAAARRRRALLQATPGADFLMRRAADDLADRLAVVNRTFDTAVDLGSAGHAPDILRASGKVGRIVRMDGAETASGPVVSIAGDEEFLPFAPASIDLAVSLLSLHEANDLPGVLVQVRRALRPDGLFVACMAGAGTLAELRESLAVAEAEVTGGVSPRVLPFADVRDAGALLQRAGFALPVADADIVTVRYDGFGALLHDLRAMGATNVLADRLKRPTRRAVFARAAGHYASAFSDADGRLRATFALLWMSGWAPHESQQQPLRPGEGRQSLAAALDAARRTTD